jgi:hypothetical protein
VVSCLQVFDMWLLCVLPCVCLARTLLPSSECLLNAKPGQIPKPDRLFCVNV